LLCSTDDLAIWESQLKADDVLVGDKQTLDVQLAQHRQTGQRRVAEKQNGKGRHTNTPGFERFWKAYPVSKDKRAAQAKFTVIIRELVADADRADIATKEQAVAFLVTRAESYAATVFDTEPRFIKHAATWLFKGSYDA